MNKQEGNPEQDDASHSPVHKPASRLSPPQQGNAAKPEESSGDSHRKTQEGRRFAVFCAAFRGHKPLEWLTFMFEVLTFAALCVYTYYAALQWHANQKSADAAKSAADTAASALTLTSRPWIKIKHRIIGPLTFNVGGRASGKTVAMAKIEDTMENVGQTVAVNVTSWEDVIPVNRDHWISTAKARQKEWCDANRTQQGPVTGYTLFPHEPTVGTSVVGATMNRVTESVMRGGGLDGKVGFVLVGCVCYKASFEMPTVPAHQTKFIYWLGVPQSDGTFIPYIFPTGIADMLRLIALPDGFTAD